MHILVEPEITENYTPKARQRARQAARFFWGGNYEAPPAVHHLGRGALFWTLVAAARQVAPPEAAEAAEDPYGNIGIRRPLIAVARVRSDVR